VWKITFRGALFPHVTHLKQFTCQEPELCCLFSCQCCRCTSKSSEHKLQIRADSPFSNDKDEALQLSASSDSCRESAGSAAAWLQKDNYRIGRSHKRLMKKYRVVRMVVQVQATITQRRWGATTLVTWDAWMHNRGKNIKIVNLEQHLHLFHQQKHVTLFCSTVGSHSVPICIQLTDWTASQPGLHSHMKGFNKNVHVWWWAEALPWESNQFHHNEQSQFFQFRA